MPALVFHWYIGIYCSKHLLHNLEEETVWTAVSSAQECLEQVTTYQVLMGIP